MQSGVTAPVANTPPEQNDVVPSLVDELRELRPSELLDENASEELLLNPADELNELNAKDELLELLLIPAELRLLLELTDDCEDESELSTATADEELTPSEDDELDELKLA